MPPTDIDQRDFDEDFEQAIAEWRELRGLREDDAVLLMIELFRIHQQHWDEIRRREVPSFEQLRSDITKLGEASRSFQEKASALTEVLRAQPPTQRMIKVTRTAAIF